MIDCLAVSYGDPELNSQGAVTVNPWPSVPNGQSGDLRYAAISSSFTFEHGFVFRVGRTTVCAAFWRDAHGVPDSVFIEMCRSILRGEVVWKPEVKAAQALASANDGAGAMSSVVEFAVAWWLERISWEEAIPSKSRLIITDACTWCNIYEDEFLFECRLVGVPEPKSISTWYEGKQRALAEFAARYFGPGPPCQLKMRSKHSVFKECTRCQFLRLDYRNALKQKLDKGVIQERRASEHSTSMKKKSTRGVVFDRRPGDASAKDAHLHQPMASLALSLLTLTFTQPSLHLPRTSRPPTVTRCAAARPTCPRTLVPQHRQRLYHQYRSADHDLNFAWIQDGCARDVGRFASAF